MPPAVQNRAKVGALTQEIVVGNDGKPQLVENAAAAPADRQMLCAHICLPRAARVKARRLPGAGNFRPVFRFFPQKFRKQKNFAKINAFSVCIFGRMWYSMYLSENQYKQQKTVLGSGAKTHRSAGKGLTKGLTSTSTCSPKVTARCASCWAARARTWPK